jgi:putative nucleotidyltransferase with HDIG domain
MIDKTRKTLGLELTPSERPGKVAFHAVRWSFLVALALLTYLLFPAAGGVEMLAVGEVATSEIIAPWDFVVPKTQDEINRDAEALVGTVLPIYEVREEAVDSALAKADVVFSALNSETTVETLIEAMRGVGVSLTPQQAEYLLVEGRREAYENAVRTMLRRQLARGVPRRNMLAAERSQRIMVRRGSSEAVASLDTLFTFQSYLESRITVHPDPGTNTVGDRVFVVLLNAVFEPTLVELSEETEELRRELRASVDTIREVVRENQRIVPANEVITEATFRRLMAFQYERIRRGRTEGTFSATAGQVLTNALLLALFWILLMLYLPRRYASLRMVLGLSLLFAIVIVGSAANARFLGTRPELIPIPYAAMLVTVLIGGRLAMVSALVLAILVGSQAVYGGVDAVFVATLGGVTAGLSVRSIRRRNQLLASVAAVTAAYLLAALTFGLRLELPFSELGLDVAAGGANATVSAALVILTLPLFEWMTGETTEVTLLELSDPHRPLLRRLATETPGTHSHSLALANLCESAANAVGANGLLTRVGCYYHDIGKLKKPQFFVENQVGGVNPHDKLKPEVSAAMIRNHVREGLNLATEHRLPDAVKAFISEHHGTMEITYFLDRARERSGDEEINLEEFRYPGPKPQSVETAIVMLGDGVEAAVRVLEDPTQQKIHDAVDHLMRRRMDAGQFDEAPITMGQLTQIRAEFVRVYEGVLHNRIDYPTASGGLSSDWDASSSS